MRWLGRILVMPAVLLVRFYQVTVSPLLPPACRYTPTCSDYAIEALRVWGPIKGSWLAAKRIMRCAPWGGSGVDPVPGREEIRPSEESLTQRRSEAAAQKDKDL